MRATIEDWLRCLGSAKDACPDDARRGHTAFAPGKPWQQALLKQRLPVAYVQHMRARPIDQDCHAVVSWSRPALVRSR